MGKTIHERLKYHFENKKFCKLERQVAAHILEDTGGYIVDVSDNFVVMQEVEDFQVLGFLIFPIPTIVKVRNSVSDKYYDKIVRLEKLIDKIGKKHNVVRIVYGQQ